MKNEKFSLQFIEKNSKSSLQLFSEQKVSGKYKYSYMWSHWMKNLLQFSKNSLFIIAIIKNTPKKIENDHS